MSKHTPGPWEFELMLDKKYRAYSQTGGQRHIAEINNLPNDWENARLIASAPDLLEALEEAIEWLDDVCVPNSEYASREGLAARDKILKAIAKATE